MSVNSIEILGSVNSSNEVQKNDIVEIEERSCTVWPHEDMFDDKLGIIKIEAPVNVFRGKAELRQINGTYEWLITDVHSVDENGSMTNFCSDLILGVYESGRISRTFRRIDFSTESDSVLDLDLSDASKL